MREFLRIAVGATGTGMFIGGLFVLVYGVFWADLTGREVFQTVSEYTEFKQWVVDNDIRIKRTKVLSSDPPIIVELDTTVPRDLDCPYGDKSDKRRRGAIIIIASLLPATYGIKVIRDVYLEAKETWEETGSEHS